MMNPVRCGLTGQLVQLVSGNVILGRVMNIGRSGVV